MKVKIVLNGTDENPYLKLGFTQNPFPAIPKDEFAVANRIVADLEANPIKDEIDLRKRLQGCTEEFINGCILRFKKGMKVTFEIEWPD